MAVAGGYWLLDDDNKPIARLTDVLLATVVSTASHAASELPRGISDDEIQDVDFKILKSQKNIRDRTAYGNTAAGKYTSKSLAVGAKVKLDKRDSARKRMREAVMAAVEGGDDIAAARKKSAKEEK
ncbi:hypothetical protein STCU_02225 [Strigomonas culicis]|uniref:Uncharacterized protein n=1 Tax=Strigomonas culicis TaxID=28005 RepID=S9UXC8_9TRYP|nr:hypothetical protein STCU_02225 [Strigomonas culicis]|eukprot:EPY33424.1 hypothetical protein STCU_02225 [Strigomonas culicis]